MLTEEDLRSLCADIDFSDEMTENLESTPAQIQPFGSENMIPLTDITLGSEFNLSDTTENTNYQVPGIPTFDLDIDALLNQPCNMSTQEINLHISNFLESDIATDIEKEVSI